MNSYFPDLHNVYLYIEWSQHGIINQSQQNLQKLTYLENVHAVFIILQ